MEHDIFADSSVDGHLAQLLVNLFNLFVDPLGGTPEFVRLGSDHLYELRHLLAADLRETRQRLHARVQLLLRRTTVEVLQQGHCQLHCDIVEHLRFTCYVRIFRNNVIYVSLARIKKKDVNEDMAARPRRDVKLTIIKLPI